MKKWISKGIQTLLIGCTAMLVLVVFAQVVFRYVLQLPLTWSEELARYLLIYMTFLGSALLIGEKGHISVDVFVQKFSPSIQRWLHVWISILLLVGSLILLVFGTKLVIGSGASLTTAMQIPFGCVYFALPLTGLLSSLYLIDDLVRGVRS
jgi:TRAP-type transport system small permease protein